MSIESDLFQRSPVEVGRELHDFAAELFPFCRSITGDGIRQTLACIQQRIPARIVENPTGTQVFDWTIPKEWNIRDAYIKDASGRRVIDFQASNLHVVNYSPPVHATLRLEQLRSHVFTIPEHPDWIPYRTCYYEPRWGFCAAERQMSSLGDGEYEVCIDSTLEEGNLVYGEYFLPGETSDEVLVSCHVCHPSLANDNLSGLTVAVRLAEHLSARHTRFSYRFLFVPGTIGAIAWLARNRERANRIRHGLVLTCIGDAGGFHYKKSRKGDAEIDRIAAHVLRHHDEPSEIMEFSPYGYDERQYCSPGFDLPVGCLMRSVWGSFPEYHTSADNLSFLQPSSLAGSLRVCAAMLDVIEGNRRFYNQSPWGEPQLGRRGLYSAVPAENLARLWVLNLSDGNHSLLDIAERAGTPFTVIQHAAQSLIEAGLLAESPPDIRQSYG